MHGFSGALSKSQVIAGNSDWLMGLLAPAVIGRSNYFGIGFSMDLWKPLYSDRGCVLTEQRETT